MDKYTSLILKKSVLIYGADWRTGLDIFKNDMGWSVAEGRWPTPSKNEIIVGSIVASETFPGMKIGTETIIKGRKFVIVGVLNSVGSKQDDSMVGIDLNIFKSVTGERTGAKEAMAKLKPGFSANAVADKLKSNLNENRKRQIGQKESDSSYTVLTSEKIASIVGSVMGLIQAVIIGFASIAIVVGGIGIDDVAMRIADDDAAVRHGLRGKEDVAVGIRPDRCPILVLDEEATCGLAVLILGNHELLAVRSGELGQLRFGIAADNALCALRWSIIARILHRIVPRPELDEVEDISSLCRLTH